VNRVLARYAYDKSSRGMFLLRSLKSSLVAASLLFIFPESFLAGAAIRYIRSPWRLTDTHDATSANDP